MQSLDLGGPAPFKNDLISSLICPPKQKLSPIIYRNNVHKSIDGPYHFVGGPGSESPESGGKELVEPLSPLSPGIGHAGEGSPLKVNN